jgi:hypothetical protein
MWRREEPLGFCDLLEGWEGNTPTNYIQGQQLGVGFVPTAGCNEPHAAVQHWGQEWRVGSTTHGMGKRVQTDTLQKYTEKADHTVITSPAP